MDDIGERWGINIGRQEKASRLNCPANDRHASTIKLVRRRVVELGEASLRPHLIPRLLGIQPLDPALVRRYESYFGQRGMGEEEQGERKGEHRGERGSHGVSNLFSRDG